MLKRLIVQMVERTAHNGFVVGSNPTKPIFLLKDTPKFITIFYVLIVKSMDYDNKTLKKYQTIKINLYIKTNTLFFFFLSNKSKSIGWKKDEQTLKKLKLTYYKTINKIVLKKLKNSIYKNFTALVCGVILLITTNVKQFKKFEIIKNLLQKNFNLISLKLNNKIYSTHEVSKISFLSYKKNLFIFYQSLEKYSKINYIFCSKNSSK